MSKTDLETLNIPRNVSYRLLALTLDSLLEFHQRKIEISSKLNSGYVRQYIAETSKNTIANLEFWKNLGYTSALEVDLKTNPESKYVYYIRGDPIKISEELKDKISIVNRNPDKSYILRVYCEEGKIELEEIKN